MLAGKTLTPPEPRGPGVLHLGRGGHARNVQPTRSAALRQRGRVEARGQPCSEHRRLTRTNRDIPQNGPLRAMSTDAVTNRAARKPVTVPSECRRMTTRTTRTRPPVVASSIYRADGPRCPKALPWTSWAGQRPDGRALPARHGPRAGR